MSLSELFTKLQLRFARLCYSFLVVLSFYLLFLSRSGEFHTVWEVMHPAFMIVFFAATLLLVGIIFSSESARYKLLFVIIHSILLHSFVFIIYPAGYAGTNQIILGRTRRIFDNLTLHTPWGMPSGSILSQLHLFIRGTNLQTAFTVVLARMFGVDVFWTQLLFVPLLWGTFVPVIAFKITRTLGGNKRISILSGLLVSLFPTLVFNGAVSVPNSLGYLFFFCSICFSLSYILHGKFTAFFLMVGFSVMCFLSHFLTGTIAISSVALAMAFKAFADAKDKSRRMARILLWLSFIFGIILMPWALFIQHLFYPIYTSFSLEKLSGLSFSDIIWRFLLGEYVNFDVETAFVSGIGPLLGLIGMVYSVVINRESVKGSRMCLWFLLSVFLVIFIDYRVLKLFMVNVPFSEERVWVMRDFSIVPFTAILIGGAMSFMRRITAKKTIGKVKAPLISHASKSTCPSLKFATVVVLVFISLSSSVIASVYYSYPRFAATQTTWYEIEAVKFIETTTTGRYIVICDQWITYAGQTLVGLNNPRAYYFYHTDLEGVRLYSEMVENPTLDPMIAAMSINNSTVAYFVVETSELGYRLRTAEFDRVVSQASLSLKIYGIFDDGKLYIFYYEKT